MSDFARFSDGVVDNSHSATPGARSQRGGNGRGHGHGLGHGNASGQQQLREFLGEPQTHDRATARPGDGNAPSRPQDSLGGLGQTLGDLGRGLQQEGIGGLLDPIGLLDRQRAERDLSNRFQVVPANFRGNRRANQVTQAEYDQIARTYSDIRLGRGDLTIDTSEMTPGSKQERDYRSGTMNALADMMMTRSGRAQVMGMSNNVVRGDDGRPRLGADGHEQHHRTNIRALYQDANGDDNLTNDPHTAANYDNTNAFADARGAHGEAGAIDTSGRSRWSRDTAGSRGQGTDSTIWWNPMASPGGTNRADVVLAHEMQHSLHETQGTMARGQYNVPGSPDNGINNFERQAVGLSTTDTPNAHDPVGLPENAYRRERNALGDHLAMRRHYSGIFPGNAPRRRH